jgi:hypothetical protein
MSIFETDTNLVWTWNGTSFERLLPRGLLQSGERTSNISNTSTAFITAVTAAVTIPDGGRPVLCMVEGPGAYDTNNITRLAIFRGSTQVQAWTQPGSNGAAAIDKPRPVSMSAKDTPGIGSFTYTLQFATVTGFGGTATLQAAGDSPLALHILEV